MSRVAVAVAGMVWAGPGGVLRAVTVIAGQTVYLKPGILPANATVVTQGAEELLGVQNGVGEET